MNRRQSQRGAIILWLCAVLVLIVLSFVVHHEWHGARPGQRQHKTAIALAEAKNAIISWSTLSATHQSAPGILPCPEDYNEINNLGKIGEARPSCVNSAPLVGRLAWRTLKLPSLQDGNGDALWYALSPGFRYRPINSDNQGRLSLNIANAGKTSAVALIISPGVAVAGQARQGPTVAPVVNAYLEGTNANGGLDFAQGMVGGNDVILAITADELMQKVEQRVLNEVAFSLWEYYCGTDNVNIGANGCLVATASSGKGYFPYAASMSDTSCLGTGEVKISDLRCPEETGLLSGRLPATAAWPLKSLLRELTVDDGPSWFQENGWREMLFYSVSPTCVFGQNNCLADTSTLTIEHPEKQPPTSQMHQKFVLTIAGKTLSGQMRVTDSDKLVRSNYLEDIHRNATSQNFIAKKASIGFNDQVRGSM